MRLFLTVKHDPNTNPCGIRDNHKQALTDLLSCLEEIDPSDLDIKHELSVFAESVFEVYIYAKVDIDLSPMLAKYKTDLLKVSYFGIEIEKDPADLSPDMHDCNGIFDTNEDPADHESSENTIIDHSGYSDLFWDYTNYRYPMQFVI